MKTQTPIWDILRRRYPANEYALMAEVSDAAGFSRSRSADYIVMNLWPSRGLHLSGIELKSFRSDWLSELKKPEKAENIFRYCDFFWLLTTDDTIAKIEEIPESWGWMYIKGEKIFVKKEAPKLTPKDMSRSFLAALLKRAQDKSDFVHVDSIKDRIEEAKEIGKNTAKYEINRSSEDLKRLVDAVREFEEASGIKLEFRDKYSFKSPKETGAAVRAVMLNGNKRIKDDLTRNKNTIEILLKGIEVSLKEIETNSDRSTVDPSSQEGIAQEDSRGT